MIRYAAILISRITGLARPPVLPSVCPIRKSKTKRRRKTKIDTDVFQE